MCQENALTQACVYMGKMYKCVRDRMACLSLKDCVYIHGIFSVENQCECVHVCACAVSVSMRPPLLCDSVWVSVHMHIFVRWCPDGLMDPQRAYFCMSVCVSKVKGTQETSPEPCGDSDLVYWLRERAGYLGVNRCLSADKLICLVSDTCSLCGRSWSSCQKPH